MFSKLPHFVTVNTCADKKIKAVALLLQPECVNITGEVFFSLILMRITQDAQRTQTCLQNLTVMSTCIVVTNKTVLVFKEAI